MVQGRFPLYGQLELQPPSSLDEMLHDPSRVVVAPELLDTLDLRVGDPILIGGESFVIGGLVTGEPDRLDFSLTLGPRVFMNVDGFTRTRLMGFGSRVSYRTLLRFQDGSSEEELSGYAKRLKEELPGGPFLRIETHHDAQPQVRRGLARFEQFLGMVALLSLLLGGTGVAQIVRSWLAGRNRSIAILRCLGYRPREIFSMYLGHVVVLAFLGSALGIVIGQLLPYVVSFFVSDLLPARLLSGWNPEAALRGLALGVGIAVVFCVPALTAVWRVSPARVLRSDIEPLPAPRGITILCGLALFGGVFASAWFQSGRADRAVAFTVGITIVALALAGGAKLVMRVCGRLPRGRNPYLYHGLAALARPGEGTVGAVIALGLGVLVVSGLALIDTRLGSEFRNALPSSAPSVFMVDVQPDQWDSVRGILEENRSTSIDSVPVVMGRLLEINGRTIAELNEERKGNPEGRWSLTREQRLTWRSELPESNEIVAGELWSDPDRWEVSVEEEYAKGLGLELGSVFSIDVQGIPLELVVTSLRRVEWQSFGINFFFMVEPGALDGAPHFRVAAARVPEVREMIVQNALAAAAPNVTVIRVRAIIEKVVGIMDKLATGVNVLGSFTIFTGLLILAGSVTTSTLRRRREAALLKTLGVTRRGVAVLLVTEYALQGLIAGAVGGIGAFVLGYAFLDQVAEIAPELPWWALPLTAIATAVMAGLTGIAASTKVLRVPPLETLRAG